ncbi:hypothetical protein [Streptomyces canus]|uniref:hypothetical protein n=1 Tax=Streptomyces canus TaxID=58343 RepID=UPI0033A6B2CC
MCKVFANLLGPLLGRLQVLSRPIELSRQRVSALDRCVSFTAKYLGFVPVGVLKRQETQKDLVGTLSSFRRYATAGQVLDMRAEVREEVGWGQTLQIEEAGEAGRRVAHAVGKLILIQACGLHEPAQQ